MQKIEIPLSKTKVAGLLIGSLLFVAIGFFMLLDDHGSSRYSPLVIKIAAIACIVFFGACGVVALKKLFSTANGLVIDELGITDTSGAVSLGLIAWEDISHISTYQVMSLKMLLIHVYDNDKYLNRLTGWKRKLTVKNLSMSGAPASINSGSLAISHKALFTLLLEKLTDYQRNKMS